MFSRPLLCPPVSTQKRASLHCSSTAMTARQTAAARPVWLKSGRCKETEGNAQEYNGKRLVYAIWAAWPDFEYLFDAPGKKTAGHLTPTRPRRCQNGSRNAPLPTGIRESGSSPRASTVIARLLCQERQLMFEPPGQGMNQNRARLKRANH